MKESSSQSGRGLPHSKSFALSSASDHSARFWSAAVLCRFGSTIFRRLSALGLAVMVTANGFAAEPDGKSVTVPFEEKRGHVLVRALMNGSNSVSLMLD